MYLLKFLPIQPLLFLIAVLSLANLSGLYLKYPLLDVPTHIIGGFLISEYFHKIIYRENIKIKTSTKKKIYLFMIIFTVFSWEILEIFSDHILQTTLVLGYFDTAKDIACGFLGAYINIYTLKNTKCKI